MPHARWLDDAARRIFPNMTGGRRTIIWAERGQESMIRTAIERAALELIGVGASSRVTANALSEAFEVDRIDDLRVAVQRDDLDLLWLAAPERLETDERRLIRKLGVPTVSNEPRPVALADLADDPDEAETAVFVPLMRRSPGYRDALDALAEFEAIRVVNVALCADPASGSLFARLFDAMDLIERLCGEAQSVDAAPAGSRATAPESLDHLRGHLTANLRFPDNRCACLSVSAETNAWYRSATIIGDAGVLRITDATADWLGSEADAAEAATPANPPSAGQLIGDQIGRIIEGLDAGPGAKPPDMARLLAMCETARLSCRTGQVEEPRRVMEMLHRP